MTCVSSEFGTKCSANLVRLDPIHSDSLEVCIYNGPGTADVEDYENALACVLPDNTQFSYLDPDAIVNGKFFEYCDLLVMPGGADKPYCEKLNGQGNKNIRAFIENGGRYYGTCAGAYYGAATLLFDEQNPIGRINETRELKLFNGEARGPLFIPYPEGGPFPALIALSSYAVHEGDPSQIILDANFTAYYLGGPFFDYPKLKDRSYKVLAYYPISKELEHALYLHPERAAYWIQDPPALAAILFVKLQEGCAVLTGVHLENTLYDGKNNATSWNREKMLKLILQKMGLKTKP